MYIFKEKYGFLISIFSWFLVLASLLSSNSCKKEDAPKKDDISKVDSTVFQPVAVTKLNSTLIFTHYMPWFEDPQTSYNGKWGQHWTMATQNPDIMDANGKRQIASHFYPLIGPYASSNANVIEYHLLLMKYSGIDGVLIDWYGIQEINDYQANNKNSEALIKMLGKVGLKFAIVYEDRTIKAAIDKDAITNGISAAQADLAYVESNYFSMKEYIRIENKPLLLVFGPEYFHKPAEWTDVLSKLIDRPCFITYYSTSGQTSPNSSGEYIWVDANTLDNKYKSKNNFPVFIGGAYPGFKDFYSTGGWGNSYNLPYPHNNGALFETNLKKAKTENIKYLQLITWNDFGEGTMIEPTQEFGYLFLESVQKFAGITYSKTELESIYNLYNLRIKKKDIVSDQIALDKSFNYFISLQTNKAISIIDSIKNIK